MNYEDTDFTSFNVDVKCTRHPSVTQFNMMGGCPECFHEDSNHGPNKVWCSALCREIVVAKATYSKAPKSHVDDDKDIIQLDEITDEDAEMMAVRAAFQIARALDTPANTALLEGWNQYEVLALTAYRTPILQLAARTEFKYA